MKLAEALGLGEDRETVAFVGGGGKTTALFRLARELAYGRCRRVLVTTTTKMYVPSAWLCPTVLLRKFKLPDDFFASAEIVTVGAGILPENKLEGLQPEVVDSLRAAGAAHFILVEADGSRGLSLKTPGPREPVIPDSATTVVIVAGLDVLGKRLNSGTVHRPELAAAMLKCRQGIILDERAVAALLTHLNDTAEYITPGARTVFLLNKLDTVDQSRALRLAELLLERGAGRVILGSVGMEDMSLKVLMP